MARIETITEPMTLNMGPHHPSMHGVLRLIVTLDGEDVIDCQPVLGYLHRGMEKIAENRTIQMYVPYVSRWDYAEGTGKSVQPISSICKSYPSSSRV